MLQVRDARAECCWMSPTTEGRDLTTFVAQADAKYELSLHDLDFAGDRSYVYRLTLTAGPQCRGGVSGRRQARRDAQRRVCRHRGRDGREHNWNRSRATWRFPSAADVRLLSIVLETPLGNAKPLTLLVSRYGRASGSRRCCDSRSPRPSPSRGSSKRDSAPTRYTLELKKGEKWRARRCARAIGLAAGSRTAIARSRWQADRDQ